MTAPMIACSPEEAPAVAAPAATPSAPRLCSWPPCHQLLGYGDDEDEHHNCAMQRMDEGLLGLDAERLRDELAEALDEYHATRRAGLESPATTERVAVMREALRLLSAAVARPGKEV